MDNDLSMTSERDFLPPRNDDIAPAKVEETPKPKRPRGRPRLSDEERARRAGHLPKRPRGRPRLSDEERALLTRPAYQASYWRRNKEALIAKRKAKLANMTEAEREAARLRDNASKKRSAARREAKIAELLNIVEALNNLLENDDLLAMGNAT